MQDGAKQVDASVILADVGPNLGAINRSALIATDCVIVPLGADLFSLQGLRNLGPTLQNWRTEWEKRVNNWRQPQFSLPRGRMTPIGYVVQQHSVRLDRPVQAYDKWVNRMPEEYARNLLDKEQDSYPLSPPEDVNRLATIKHYRSLGSDGTRGTQAHLQADTRGRSPWQSCCSRCRRVQRFQGLGGADSSANGLL